MAPLKVSSVFNMKLSHTILSESTSGNSIFRWYDKLSIVQWGYGLLAFSTKSRLWNPTNESSRKRLWQKSNFIYKTKVNSSKTSLLNRIREKNEASFNQFNAEEGKKEIERLFKMAQSLASNGDYQQVF